MKENWDALATANPEPLIPTLRDGVLANKFPIENKIIYAIFNTNANPVSGPILSVPSIPNTHFMELLYDKEPQVQITDGIATISMEIAGNDVVYLAQLHNTIEVKDAKTMDVSVSRKSNSQHLQIAEDTAGVDKRKIIKLFDNDALIDEVVIIEQP